MERSQARANRLRFGVFELDVRSGELFRSGARLRLPEQPFQILRVLLENPGKIVTREELRKRIWPADTFVDFDHSLYTAVNKLREALHDSSEHPRFIETLPRRGYRFIAQVGEVEAGTTPAVPAGTGLVRLLKSLPLRTRVTGLLVLVGGISVALTLAVTVSRSLHARRASGPRKIQSLAVLPLENLSHDPEQEYFAEGMTDELITNLAQISALRVISRGSVLAYKGKHVSTPQIARDLNVDALVEGTVSRSGDRVRITAQLIEAKTDRHLWAQTYERELRDILGLQDELARSIASEIEVKLTPQERELLGVHRMVDPGAHEDYLRGLYELHGIAAESTEDLRSQSIQRAIEFFQQALSRDSNDALAYAGLADAYASLSTKEKAPLEVMPRAKAAALKAIELDDTLAEAHASLGFIKLFFDWDWPGAGQELHKALELNPNLALAHANYAKYLLLIHRADEGIQELRRAYSLDPLVPSAHGGMAWFLFEERRYSESIEAAKAFAEEDDPIVGLSYVELGRGEEALAAADRAAQHTQDLIALAHAATVYAITGKTQKAHALLKQILQYAQQRYICGFNMACVYAALGDKEQAFAWLDKAYLSRSD